MNMINNTRISLNAVGGASGVLPEGYQPPSAREEKEKAKVRVTTRLFNCFTHLHTIGVPFLEPYTPLRQNPSSQLATHRHPVFTSAPHREGFLRTCKQALKDADEALEVAQDNNFFQLEARAQIFRGHCFRAMGKWQRALDCYIRGASVKGPRWGQADIEGLTEMCRSKLRGERRVSESMFLRYIDRHRTHNSTDQPSGSWFVHEVTGDHLVAVLDEDGRPVGPPRVRPPLRRVKRATNLRGDGPGDTSEKNMHSFAVRVHQGIHLRAISSPRFSGGSF